MDGKFGRHYLCLTEFEMVILAFFWIILAEQFKFCKASPL